MEAARRCGIPAPSVVHVGLSAVCAWSIQEWIDGTRAPNTPETYRVLGDYARRLAQHTVTPPLGMFADANVDWRAQVQYNINQLTPHDPLIQLNVYATHAQTLVRDVFVMLGHHKFAVGLDHGDLTPRNVIARSNGPAVLIDWGCATYDVCPFAALARVYAARALHNTPSVTGAAAFVDGCGVASNFAVNMLPRVRAWAVLKAVDLVRWAIDRCPERVAETSDIARRIVATAIRTPS